VKSTKSLADGSLLHFSLRGIIFVSQATLREPASISSTSACARNAAGLKRNIIGVLSVGKPTSSMDATMIKLLKMQHEITEELERRSGVKGLKLIRLKGYTPSWDLGGIRATALDEAAEGELQKCVADLQGEVDMA
jgi:hypothetical protein